ncbi:MAG: EscU/YscU/HrcU family type III secretion system export apparatus switch protein [Pseudomonadota bacterium]|nr:EscU/YscU/HrcU family type III secretion system export apparatus switch protein [Pseudomonadota bacterium]
MAVKDASIAGNLPRVVASGRGSVAEQILEIAWANDIKVREDADLVEVLSAIDVESEIPIEVFATVAEILSYVYRTNAGQVPSPDDAPGSDKERANE